MSVKCKADYLSENRQDQLLKARWKRTQILNPLQAESMQNVHTPLIQIRRGGGTI